MVSNLLTNKLATEALMTISHDPDFSEEVSRDAMDIFAQVLSRGHSGEELEVVQRFQTLYQQRMGYASYALEMAESYVRKHMQGN